MLTKVLINITVVLKGRFANSTVIPLFIYNVDITCVCLCFVDYIPSVSVHGVYDYDVLYLVYFISSCSYFLCAASA